MGQRLIPLSEREENTTSQPTNPPSLTAHSPPPSPENTAQSNDSESQPYSHALAFLTVSSMIAALAVPLTPPRDTHNIDTSLARLDPLHSPNLSHHACPTAHLTTPGFASPSPRTPIPRTAQDGSNILLMAYGNWPSAPSRRHLSSNHAAPGAPQPDPGVC